jgi:hypothetical protein
MNSVLARRQVIWHFFDTLTHFGSNLFSDATDALHKAPKKIDMELLHHKYRNSKKRVFFLDYDGTLVAIASKPHLAVPTDKMLDIIRKLASVSLSVLL